ncbi:MAG: rod shape-determining protein MreD [Spirochaetales bacterium]|nr:rod shape-determining protein MreD [Leptospiraceae bacterium]MCP5483554.1 rod shape-determining protein MreD [Spirochaetales bacterium]MCP5486875.1 rod shape-determining protein MreD [Spirochaetales bacterium]
MFLEISVVTLGMMVSYFLTEIQLLKLNFDFLDTGVVHPDFLLIFLIFFALYRGELVGIWVGFFAGLLMDGTLWRISEGGNYVSVIGVHASIYSLAGFILGKMNRIFDRYRLAPLFVLVLGTGIVVRFLAWTMAGIFLEFNRSHAIVVPALYTAVLAPIWFALLSWVYRIQPGEVP